MRIKLYLLVFVKAALIAAGLQANPHTADAVINHVKKCIAKAMQESSKLHPDILNIAQETSAKILHFLNNLCMLSNTNYLEIDLQDGANFMAALYINKKWVTNAFAIDDWQNVFDDQQRFINNTRRHIANHPFFFCNSSITTMQKQGPITSNPITIFFCKGNMSAEDQKRAFNHINDLLDDLCIIIIGDYNWQFIQDGTREAFNELGYKVLYGQALPSRFNYDRETWWNGLYVAVIRK